MLLRRTFFLTRASPFLTDKENRVHHVPQNYEQNDDLFGVAGVFLLHYYEGVDAMSPIYMPRNLLDDEKKRFLFKNAKSAFSWFIRGFINFKFDTE